MPKSWAIGVNKLTGKNSTIIRQATQNATEKTADQFGRVMASAPRFSAINSLMVLPVACFRGKADHFNIEMCDAFNVFATFTVLWESSRLLEEIKIIGQGDMYFRDCVGNKG
ncbi:hypothetical protein HMPREF1613_05378 [Escherichia coli 908616]|nr:hypothetical protein HMPREF1599_00620 [Escherichia coli 907713]ESD47763.1 hypothetical protein HMPREF1606_05221 [Escherichia coli 908522]ESD81430.1 hypothetical protein HMPREF1613_05378 [Escherichia coli 908616]KXH03903.1 hypothetical protein HMPREF3040_00039 [Escherichia coli]